ncbi:hypothetical protein Anas_11538 [Armadillidium nasatum]|uniref:RRM domain-containing protein n=1 Tax=Armadillidium nasatum TaxID=96803 RepID=A0A5N5TCZ6_9CRUS|nr:hypothetical protein Anas_11538 [Armadillidium nasatum]
MKNSEQKTMKNLDSKSKTVLKKNTANKKSSEMKANLAASPENSPKTNIKRKSNENLSGENKKQKLHTKFSVLSNSQHINEDQVKVTFSFPSERLNINRKEVLQQILEHCDSIENPRNIFCYSEEEESLKKTFDNLKDFKFGNRSLFLRYFHLPSSNSSELVKKVLLLPTKHVSKLNDIKKYYNAVSVEKVVELEGQNLYFLFMSKTEAEAAVKKEGYSLDGFAVTLKDYCENEEETHSEKENKKNQKGNIKNEENKNSNDNSGEEDEEEDIGDDEEDEDEEEDEDDANEEMENDDDDDDGDDDDDDDDDDEEEGEEEEEEEE